MDLFENRKLLKYRKNSDEDNILSIETILSDLVKEMLEIIETPSVLLENEIKEIYNLQLFYVRTNERAYSNGDENVVFQERNEHGNEDVVNVINQFLQSENDYYIIEHSESESE